MCKAKASHGGLENQELARFNFSIFGNVCQRRPLFPESLVAGIDFALPHIKVATGMREDAHPEPIRDLRAQDRSYSAL